MRWMRKKKKNTEKRKMGNQNRATLYGEEEY